MNQGRCLCGNVTWQVTGSIQHMSHCHCSRCRKAHGTPFATYVAVAADDFRMHPSPSLERFPSPGFSRNFCSRCGSVVPADPVDGLAFVPAGNFTDDPGCRPLVHIFVASKAPWFEIPDSLPQYDTYPPGIDATILPDEPRERSGGIAGGSCLCGGIVYVIERTPRVSRYCHCGRCRQARSAAHAANLVTSDDGVRFLRGEELLMSYKVPEARFFSQVFCRICGGCMPRRDAERKIAVVPMGSLDDDPGIRPREHIFVGSKAPWFEIADRLPQYPEQAPA